MVTCAHRETLASGFCPDCERDVSLDPLITVCDACLCASCWQGVFYCQRYKSAGTKRMRRSELAALDRESPDYWEARDGGEGGGS